MDSVEAELKKINTNFELMSNEILKTQGSGAQMKELTRDNEINGIKCDDSSIQRCIFIWPTSNGQLVGSLLFPSGKSEKQSLDSKRVQSLIGLIRKRYGDQWNIKLFTSKANQDTKPTDIDLCM